MSFSSELINYMNLLNCTAKDICTESGLSPSLVSRYINGKRTPKANSKYMEQIIDALYKISVNNSVGISKLEIKNKITNVIGKSNVEYDSIADNLNALLDVLKFSISDLPKAIGYDPSFISRIKNKERRPSDITSFIKALSDYVFNYINNEPDKTQKIMSLFNCSIKNLCDSEHFEKIFFNWMLTYRSESDKQSILNFLTNLDDFNIEDYICKKNEEFTIPTKPIILKKEKKFYGSTGRKKAETEFIRASLISESNDPIFYYSDFPIANITKDESYKKDWIIAITMLLKKSIHLNIVHNIDRPIDEMLLGLENWIPLYMTGAISPYYFETAPSGLFFTLHCVSESVALSGEGLKGNENSSKFFITTNTNDLKYAKEKAIRMLSKAKPLLKIYTEQNHIEFMKFENENKNSCHVKTGIFKNIDFTVNPEWIMISRKKRPHIHFVVYNEKLISALKKFLEQN